MDIIYKCLLFTIYYDIVEISILSLHHLTARKTVRRVAFIFFGETLNAKVENNDIVGISLLKISLSVSLPFTKQFRNYSSNHLASLSDGRQKSLKKRRQTN